MNELSAIFDTHWTPAAILTGLESLALFAAGIWIARQRARSSPVLRRFSALVLFSAATLGSVAMMYAAPAEGAASGWVRFALLCCPWVPLFLHAVAGTVGNVSRFSLVATLGAAALSVIGVRTTLFTAGFRDYWWGRYPMGSPYLALLIAFWVVMVALSSARLFANRGDLVPASSGARTRELQWMVGAGAVATLDFAPALGVPFPPIGSVLFVGVILRVAINERARELLFPVTIEMAAEQVVDAMADGVMLLDADGRIVVVNNALERMLGYTSSEIRGESVRLLVDEKGEDTSKSDRMRAVLHGRTIRDVERVFRTRDGETIPVSVSMSASGGDDQEIVMVVRDIRTRKKADAEIRQTASLLRSILDSTQDAILVVASDGSLLTWNRRLDQLFDLRLENTQVSDPVGTIEAILSKLKDSSRFADEIMKAGADVDEPSPVVLEMIDGRVLECASIPYRLGGENIGRVWSLTEVTERRRAEAALRESERRYRLLFERNAAGVYSTSLDGTIVDCNDAYARMFGWAKAADLIGTTCLEFYFDDDERESLIAMLRDVGSLTGVELRLRRRDGREIWVMENLTLVQSEDGPLVDGTLVDISSLKIAEEQMEFQAYHDVLTVLPNRRLFIDRLTLAVAHARRTNASLAVMYLDLDHFKTVNDTLGHTAGDELLLAVAERLRDAVREEDTVARLGGDEFTILTAGLKEPQDAIVVAEKILASVRRPVEVGDAHLAVTASLGIAFYPDDGEEPESLIKSADSALYRAKELGRDNYQLCTPQLKVRAIERMALETELRESMSRGELLLHYQPVVRLDSGAITSVEALLRWNHPHRGLVMPAAFLDVAEASRLCLRIDLWVIEEACRQLRAWHDSGYGHLAISTNLSVHHLQQKDLPKRIEAILSEHGIAPEKLQLELTEKSILDSREIGVPILRELRELGVSIAIDDFGTGYTSLNYLKHLPLDAVKIDRSMVNSLPLNAGDAALVASIVNVARLLKLRVVAEGVETAEQVRLLRERRCNEVQGHLFSAALPAESLEGVLERSGSSDPRIDVMSILGSGH